MSRPDTRIPDRPPAPAPAPPGRPAGPDEHVGNTTVAAAVARARPGLGWSAGFAVAAASTAMAGVFSGWTWLGAVIVVVVLVVLVGTVLRAANVAPSIVAAAQFVAVACLLTLRFTTDGLLGILPTPTAAQNLGRLIAEGVGQIESSAPPVPTTPELLVLVTIAIGVVAIVVDVLAVPGRAPAAAGLVLLCIVAIPAALADSALPAWTLICGALGFAVLLASNRPRPAGPGWIGITAVAVTVALAVGALATAVGTAGRLPNGSTGVGALGLNPFTSLRGALENPESFELFQVNGLIQPGYLRAVTLAEYVPQRGWQIGAAGQSVPLTDALPISGAETAGQQAELRVTNVGYRDNWLPLYGVPLGVSGLDRGAWTYDLVAGVARSESPRQEEAWRQRAALPAASAEALRGAPDRGPPDPRYTDTGGIDERVVALARQITNGARTDFDRAVALNEYFVNPANGFTYSLQTAPGNTGDALVDFLSRGRAGYCEQFASAMAVMLRAVGVPARVAVGFTAGVDTGQHRSITSRDAHAWVEAYFPGFGWLTFDPTPLADGRGIVPPYVAEATGRQPGPTAPEAAAPAPSAAAETTQPVPADDPAAGADQSPPSQPLVPSWLIWTVLGVLAVGMLVVTPATLRSVVRSRRLQLAAAGGPGAATAAWHEVVAESVDRRVNVPPTDTVRMAADRMVRRHALDPPAAEAMRQLVAAVEESWYADPSAGDSAVRDDRLSTAVHGVCGGLQRCAPLDLPARLLPRSLLHPSLVSQSLNRAGRTASRDELSIPAR